MKRPTLPGEHWSDTEVLTLKRSIAALQRKAKVLIVEDNPLDAVLLLARLRHFPCESTVCATEPSCRELICSSDYDVIFLDIHLTPGDGLSLMTTATKCGRKAKFIVLTGQADDVTMQKALALGSVAVLVKPIKREDIAEIPGAI